MYLHAVCTALCGSVRPSQILRMFRARLGQILPEVAFSMLAMMNVITGPVAQSASFNAVAI